MLICASGGRFPRARPQPNEQRRVRFAEFLRTLRKLRHPALNASLLFAKAVLRNGFRWSRRLTLQSTRVQRHIDEH